MATSEDRVPRVIRTDGTIEILEGAPPTIREVEALIHAQSLDTITLHHLGEPTVVMVLDDLGIRKNLPVNPEATRLYHANCRPGWTAEIRGDVVILLD